MATNEIPRRSTATVKVNGAELAYVDVGEGPDLVLLHGALVSTGPRWAGSPAAHVDHFATLGQHFRVIAPDTRGSGASVHPGRDAGFDVLVDDVVGLIDALDLRRPHVVGFSEGGVTATLLTLRRPDLVGALVNHAGFDVFDPDAPAHHGLRPLFGGSPDATRADPDAAAAAFASMGPPMAGTFAIMQADYDDAQGAGHWREYLGQFFDRSAAPLSASVTDFGRLERPTLFLTGDRDMFCTVEAACAAYRTALESELAIVPGTAHEITPAMITTTMEFLQRHAATEP
jgi:pimeloyl-ACP methyl ester carboxylesterase